MFLMLLMAGLSSPDATEEPGLTSSVPMLTKILAGTTGSSRCQAMFEGAINNPWNKGVTESFLRSVAGKGMPEQTFSNILTAAMNVQQGFIAASGRDFRLCVTAAKPESWDVSDATRFSSRGDSFFVRLNSSALKDPDMFATSIAQTASVCADQIYTDGNADSTFHMASPWDNNNQHQQFNTAKAKLLALHKTFAKGITGDHSKELEEIATVFSKEFDARLSNDNNSHFIQKLASFLTPTNPNKIQNVIAPDGTPTLPTVPLGQLHIWPAGTIIEKQTNPETNDILYRVVPQDTKLRFNNFLINFKHKASELEMLGEIGSAVGFNALVKTYLGGFPQTFKAIEESSISTGFQELYDERFAGFVSRFCQKPEHKALTGRGG